MSIRKAIRQSIETNALLGLRDIPYKPTAPIPAPRIASDESSESRLAADRSAETSAAIDVPLPVDPEQKPAALADLFDEYIKECTKCALCQTRTRTVPGQGHANARLVFVGEAPGFEEDRQGLAFVGRAGQLLTRMIQAMGLARDEVFICNVLKCRPPNNRTPAADEIAACSPYLFEQLRIIEPEVIVALGAPAAQTLLQTGERIGRLRGRFHEFSLPPVFGQSDPIPLMPTYHPAYLLRTPADKAKTWDDLKKVMTRLDLEIPEKYR